MKIEQYFLYLVTSYVKPIKLNTMIGLATTVDFTSKVEALRYALESTSKFEERTVIFNYDAAQELYDFICKNVNIPDVNKTPTQDLLPLIDALTKKIEGLDASKDYCVKDI